MSGWSGRQEKLRSPKVATISSYRAVLLRRILWHTRLYQRPSSRQPGEAYTPCLCGGGYAELVLPSIGEAVCGACAEAFWRRLVALGAATARVHRDAPGNVCMAYTRECRTCQFRFTTEKRFATLCRKCLSAQNTRPTAARTAAHTRLRGRMADGRYRPVSQPFQQKVA